MYQLSDQISTEGIQVYMDTTHLLSVEFKLLPSGRRYRYPNVNTHRAKNELIPMETTQLNKMGGGVWLEEYM